MRMRITLALLFVVFLASFADAQNRFHRRRGAIIGGLAGAAIGAAIGDKGDNETAGALIGGAVGAVAGGTIGDQKDKRIEHYQRYHTPRGYQTYRHPHGAMPAYQQRYYAPGPLGYPQQPAPPVLQPVEPVLPAAPLPSVHQPVTTKDVVAMFQSGLSEPVIIQQIQINGVMQQLTVSEVIQLHQLGVSERIITAMQAEAPLAGSNAPVVDQPQTLNEPETFGPSILVPVQ